MPSFPAGVRVVESSQTSGIDKVILKIDPADYVMTSTRQSGSGPIQVFQNHVAVNLFELNSARALDESISVED